MKLAQFISSLLASKLISIVHSYNYGARTIDHLDVLRIATVNRTSGHHRILWDPNKSDWAFHPESPLQILVSAFENLNYTLVFPPDNSYGTQTNHVFSGILGLLQNQEADVGMGLFSVVEERLQVVNYTTYLGSDTFTILMKNMESVSKVEGIIAPFQNFVWICIIMTSLLMGLIIYVFIHWLEKKKPGSKPRLSEIYWFIYGALLRQSSSYDPDTNATRTLFGTWWVFVVIMTASYTGGLTAFMTSPDNNLPVNNLQDLQTRTSAKWVTVKGTALESFIKNEPILQSLRNDLDNGRGHLVDTLEEATQRVLTEDETYFLVEKAVAEREILKGHIQLFGNKEVNSADSSKLTCPLTIPRHGYQFLHLPYGLVVAKGASRDLMPFMNQKIGEVMDNGLFHRALRLRKPAEKLLLDICTTQDDQKLTLRDFLATFGIILFGYVISSMMLSGEYLWNLAKRNSITKVYQVKTATAAPKRPKISRLEIDMSYAREKSEF